MKKYETPNGKEICLIRCPKTTHIKIQFGSGGELPSELGGLFTSERNAEVAINTYIDKMTPKKKENAESRKTV